MLGKLYSGMTYSGVRHEFNVNELSIYTLKKVFLFFRFLEGVEA